MLWLILVLVFLSEKADLFALKTLRLHHTTETNMIWCGFILISLNMLRFVENQIMDASGDLQQFFVMKSSADDLERNRRIFVPH